MYIINPIWFYLIGVAEAIQSFFLSFGIMGISAIIVVGMVIAVDGTINKFKKLFITGAIISIVFCLIGTLIPNKETCYSMAIASVATTENLEYAAEAGKNIIDYITEKAIELIEAGE